MDNNRDSRDSTGNIHASFQTPLDDAEKSIQCNICVNHCVICSGKRGRCQRRVNRDGILYADNYGMVISHSVDPIEKKPLYHFQPQTYTYSIAAAGCNLSCDNCQNWEISQPHLHSPLYNRITQEPPEEIVLRARATNCSSISFTYTEPTIWFEYIRDVGRVAHMQSLRTVMVTNGTITNEALAELIPAIDAYCVDIKAFSDEFYRTICHAPIGTFEQVLSSCKQAYDAGLHVEIVNLLIPGKNDDPKEIAELCEWIASALSKDVPVHFTRYHPQYRMQISATPVQVLERAYLIAREHGLLYPYIGNVLGHKYEHTYCPECETMVIKRDRSRLESLSEVLLVDGCCQVCGYQVLS
ncbi:MAG: AmmeMemoRadiSam system radical SAM enzyme [Methanomicrobiales archaeon]|nr:AmmeMemoRadiSam system radical SAM enzyme [Methanomicrobiales archaeon]